MLKILSIYGVYLLITTIGVKDFIIFTLLLAFGAIILYNYPIALLTIGLLLLLTI